MSNPLQQTIEALAKEKGIEPDGGVLIDAEDGRRHRVPMAVITRANLEVEF